MKQKSKSLSLSVHGINIKVNSDNPYLIDYIKEYYKPFVSSQKKYDLKVYIIFKKYLSKPSKNFGGKTTIGDKNTIDENTNTLFYKEGELNISVKRGNFLEVKTEFRPHNQRHILHLGLFGPRKVKLYYYRKIMKYSIHDPLFYLLETRYGIDVLHASAVEKNNFAIVFTGLGGAGKSSLVTELISKKGYKLVSDNYLLFKKDFCYPFPERLRVKKESLSLSDTKTIKADGNKYYLDTGKTDISKKKIGAVIIVTRGKKYKLTKVTPENAFDKLFMIGEFTSEFHYHEYISLLSYLHKKINTTKKRTDRLYEFTKTVKIYTLTVTPNITVDTKKILSKIK